MDYKNAHTKVEVICPLHGSFKTKPYHHYVSKSGCPKCKESKGERTVRQFLERNNIKYTYQYTDPTCRYINVLHFDFAIFKDDRMILVEYNGEQHYRPVGFGGNAAKLFKKIQRSDRIKKKWCKDNNHELIVISYDDSVEQILGGLNV